ncbi:S-DNA-T family DNA segregation ATPase FtsK/SpoIIIE [Sagittula marina]|uniref:DNA translocase FtsK n=1 Tax=Sagittula marina TaxID=943940 RepID=A0A7W6GSP5_9RHOB|nr:DNA translocase FtsK 4TM domain-containing protein [Sagittula marina]MBB3984319.1 S-DNA-T family DNA segregation ATPase FtsK/SpoIIIE [Sagittula marina]
MASYQVNQTNRRRDPLLDSGTTEVLEKRGRELVGLVLVLLGLMAAAMIASYSPDDPSWLSATDAPAENWMGRLGAFVAAPLFMIVGTGAWALAAVLVVWGARFAMNKAQGRAFGCLIFAPIWIAVCAVYASGLPHGNDWSHHFGLGGLFGDMVMGSALTALDGLGVSPATGLKFMMLMLGGAILGLGIFVLGFTKAELKFLGRFLLVGVIMTYAQIVRLTGVGASGAMGAARKLQEKQADRRANRTVQAEAARDHVAVAAPRVQRAVPPMRAMEDDLDVPLLDDEEMAQYEAAAAEEKAEKGGFLSRMPSLMRRSEPQVMPQPELVDNLMDHDVDAPEPDRISAKIAHAVKARHPYAAPVAARRDDPTKPLTRGRGHGPKPLIFSPAPRTNGLPPEPPLTAGPATLPPEPPVTARDTVRSLSAPAVGAAMATMPPAAKAASAPAYEDAYDAPYEDAPYDDLAHEAPAYDAAPTRNGPDATAYAEMPAPASPRINAGMDDAYGEMTDFDDYGDDYDAGDYDEAQTYGDEPSAPASSSSAPPIQRGGNGTHDLMPEAKKVVQQPIRKPVQLSTRAKLEAQPSLAFDEKKHAEYELPPLNLLMSPEAVERHHLSDEALEENARMLESVLDDYGVKGEIVSVRPGPVVTMYELEPAPGLKASRVIGLSDDIARSMSALSARVSTVPGRSVIGIELPNDKREMVCFREILAGRDFGDGNQKLPLALGKDIGGDPVVANLAKMPHLLIAGTTGSGKSVAINTMILSLLYKLTPEDLRLVMIDPKMLELSVYDGIPHLLSPVVTDPKKAVVALKWVVGEMEDRYRKMSKMGVRNIDGYNSRVADALSKGEMFSRTVQTGFDEESGEPVFETDEFEPKKMPYIVVIVDEMADLMMVAGKEIEACIQRLAQMARASGIHLIMATQRPSVDVITGTIKANFPTRISFQVTSKIDSRTILGEMGAEQLLGMGDMLFMAGGAKITRCHGPFVSDEEVEEIVNHLKAFGPPDYVGGVVEGPAEEKADNIDAVLGLNTGGNTGGEDALYDQAVAIVIKDRKCSTSYIQRKLGIGYNKAARLVEQMEDESVVSAANHVGKREILVPEQA